MEAMAILASVCSHGYPWQGSGETSVAASDSKAKSAGLGFTARSSLAPHRGRDKNPSLCLLAHIVHADDSGRQDKIRLRRLCGLHTPSSASLPSTCPACPDPRSSFFPRRVDKMPFDATDWVL